MRSEKAYAYISAMRAEAQIEKNDEMDDALEVAQIGIEHLTGKRPKHASGTLLCGICNSPLEPDYHYCPFCGRFIYHDNLFFDV